MELNRMIGFSGVTEAQFHSIFRRSLIIRVQGRFVEAEAFNQIGNAKKFGVFPRAADLKQFLRSGPAVVAGLRMQLSFEKQHSRDACQKLITDYSYGGADGGLTERLVRLACNLSPKPIRPQPATQGAGLPKGVDLGLGSQDNDEHSGRPAVGVARSPGDMRVELVRYMITKGFNFITNIYFRSFPTPASERGNKKADLWKQIAEGDDWRRQQARNTKSQGSYYPFLRTNVPYKDIVKPIGEGVQNDIVYSLPEMFNIPALQKYHSGNAHRVMNAAIMQEA